jgi:hypothetical protein
MIPLQFTVLVLTVKIPALSQSPLTVSVLDPDIVKVAPDPIVMFLQVPPAEPITGFTEAEERIITSVVDVGTTPPHQFPDVFQSAPKTPNHVPAIHEVLIFKIPLVLLPKTAFLMVADEPVPPHSPVL